ncbi:L,D-transpeptidase, partial [Mesorhizobium sp. M7A.F.Ca.CA.002.04.1.1]
QSAEPLPAEAMNVALTGNNGELRSEVIGQKKPSGGGLFAGLFGGTSSGSSISYLPETRALDQALAKREAKKQFKVKPEFVPQDVEFTGYDAGTIVIDTSARRLYLVESSSTARRYAIAVGREGLQFKGTVAVGDKQEWPRWIPTLDMQKREPKHYGQYKDGMPGGGQNPLGARAIYLYDGKKDTHLRIHGTIAPQSIGTSASNGCFRMINEHVMDLYSRVRVGTKVVII